MGAGGSKSRAKTTPEQLQSHISRKFVPNYLLDPDRLDADDYTEAVRDSYYYAVDTGPLDNNYVRQKPPSKPDTSAFARKQQQAVFSLIRRNTWFYRDRLNVARGPCVPAVLREAWESGFIDENTLVWGNGMTNWVPIRNVRSLKDHIRTPQVILSTWITKWTRIYPALSSANKQRKKEQKPERGWWEFKYMH